SAMSLRSHYISPINLIAARDSVEVTHDDEHIFVWCLVDDTLKLNIELIAFFIASSRIRRIYLDGGLETGYGRLVEGKVKKILANQFALIFPPQEGQRIFLEYRAFDGLTFSATLHLERFLQWTGVLMEPDDKLYGDMESVHRNCYGVHACISPNEHPCNAFVKPLLKSIPKGAYVKTLKSKFKIKKTEII
ncbi:hypothetical protein QYM36_019100, partial [Artemia franciscana]